MLKLIYKEELLCSNMFTSVSKDEASKRSVEQDNLILVSRINNVL